jgi:hypothetical protein
MPPKSLEWTTLIPNLKCLPLSLPLLSILLSQLSFKNANQVIQSKKIY